MNEKIESIQFMRFVAACLVVFFHSTQAVNQYFNRGIVSGILYASEFGAAGVHIFFVISGFIMVYTSYPGPTGKFSAQTFFVRRFIRIFPIYWVYCSLYLAFHQFFGQAYSAPVEAVVLSLLLLPGYSPMIIGPGWTLSYEVYFYVCFGAAMSFGLARGLLVLTVFFFLSIVSRLVFQAPGPVLQVMTDSLLIEFLLGAGIGFLVVRKMKIGDGLAVAFQGVALAGFFVGYLVGFRRFPSLLIWGIPSALLLAGLVFGERNARIPQWMKKCAFLGDCSYSLYLLHILLIDVFLGSYKMMVGELGSGSIGISVILTLLCVVVSFAAYEFVERNLIWSVQFLVGSSRKARRAL